VVHRDSFPRQQDAEPPVTKASTLAGLAFGMTYGRPEPSIEAIAGAPAIKTATFTVTIDYETDAPLA
jgi:hypothetical protein